MNAIAQLGPHCYQKNVGAVYVDVHPYQVVRYHGVWMSGDVYGAVSLSLRDRHVFDDGGDAGVSPSLQLTLVRSLLKPCPSTVLLSSIVATIREIFLRSKGNRY